MTRTEIPTAESRVQEIVDYYAARGEPVTSAELDALHRMAANNGTIFFRNTFDNSDLAITGVTGRNVGTVGITAA